MVPLERLRPAVWNANRVPPKTLAKVRRSIETFGLVENLVAREHPEVAGAFEVLSGNHRAGLLAEMGFAEAPVVLNRTRGDDDPEAYARLLEDVLGSVSSSVVVGFLPETEGSIDRVLAALRPPVVDEVPPVPTVPRSVRGEVYELGPHRLMCGDSTNQGDVAELISGTPLDIVFTDPPYGVNYQGDEDDEGLRRRHRREDGRATVGNDALGAEGTRALVEGFLSLARASCRPGAAFYICSPSGLPEMWFRSGVADAGLELRQVIVWAKDVFAFGRQDYHWRHESILYGWFPGAAHTWNGGRGQDTVWEIPRPKRSEEHPTMKPVDLVSRALTNSSDPGAVVYDPFAGSGTTLIAAEHLGRRCFAMELDPGYCDVIRDRYERYVGAPSA